MKNLIAAIKNMQEYRSLLQELQHNNRVSLYGAAPVHRAHFVSALREDIGRPICVVTSDDAASRHFAADVESFTGITPAVLVSRDMIFHDAEGVSRDTEQQRMAALHAFGSGKKDIIIGSAEAFMLRTLPKDLLFSCGMVIEEGESYDIGELCAALVNCGYTRCEQIEGAGQFAVRG